MQKHFPNKLLELRKQLGLTQEEVRIKLGFASTDRLSHWERGSSVPHIVNLFKLCQIYQVLPHEVYPEFC